MHQNIQELFFSLIRCTLWGGQLDVEAGDISRGDLGGVIKMAKSQTVLGLIAHEVMTREQFAALLGAESRAKLTMMVQSNLLHYQRLNAVLISIVLELRKYGIDPVLLKGQGISKCYPIPELRQCGDIDIYVGQENFAKACEVIGEMSAPEDHQGDIASLKHFHTKIGSVFIEIHRFTDVYYPRRYDLKYQKISDAGMHSNLVPMDFVGAEVLTPSIDFNVFFIFNHFWHHFISDGVGLRQICDWVRLLHVNYGKIDLDYLYNVLHELKLMKEWQVFGYIAVNTLGLPADEMPFYDAKYEKIALKLLNLIIREGNFGVEKHKEYKRPEGYFAGKLYTLTQNAKRDLYIFQIFPMQALKHISYVFFSGMRNFFGNKSADHED